MCIYIYVYMCICVLTIDSFTTIIIALSSAELRARVRPTARRPPAKAGGSLRRRILRAKTGQETIIIIIVYHMYRHPQAMKGSFWHRRCGGSLRRRILEVRIRSSGMRCLRMWCLIIRKYNYHNNNNNNDKNNNNNNIDINNINNIIIINNNNIVLTPHPYQL